MSQLLLTLIHLFSYVYNITLIPFLLLVLPEIIILQPSPISFLFSPINFVSFTLQLSTFLLFNTSINFLLTTINVQTFYAPILTSYQSLASRRKFNLVCNGDVSIPYTVYTKNVGLTCTYDL